MARPESAKSSTGRGTPATLPEAPLMAACSGGSHSSCARAGGQSSVPSAVGVRNDPPHRLLPTPSPATNPPCGTWPQEEKCSDHRNGTTSPRIPDGAS